MPDGGLVEIGLDPGPIAPDRSAAALLPSGPLELAMHATSLENMRRCVERHLGGDWGGDWGGDSGGDRSVLDVGGADLNGSYRELFPAPRYRYRVADISEGPSVDVRLTDPYRFPLD